MTYELHLRDQDSIYIFYQLDAIICLRFTYLFSISVASRLHACVLRATIPICLTKNLRNAVALLEFLINTRFRAVWDLYPYLLSVLQNWRINELNIKPDVSSTFVYLADNDVTTKQLHHSSVWHAPSYALSFGTQGTYTVVSWSEYEMSISYNNYNGAIAVLSYLTKPNWIIIIMTHLFPLEPS